MTELEFNFKGIYNENYAKVMRLCLGYASGDRDLANDLTQEVFIKVWSSLKSFRKESNINTWIYRIAVNTCLMNLRKKKSKPLSRSLPSEDVSGDMESSQNKEKQYQEMYRCINTLNATNKAIILMELEGLAQKEIAEVMGLKHEAVRTRIHRIKTQLSKCVHHE
jgi:RNA polymerase sigma-70 factor (ECF subfamily)